MERHRRRLIHDLVGQGPCETHAEVDVLGLVKRLIEAADCERGGAPYGHVAGWRAWKERVPHVDLDVEESRRLNVTVRRGFRPVADSLAGNQNGLVVGERRQHVAQPRTSRKHVGIKTQHYLTARAPDSAIPSSSGTALLLLEQSDVVGTNNFRSVIVRPIVDDQDLDAVGGADLVF